MKFPINAVAASIFLSTASGFSPMNVDKPSTTRAVSAVDQDTVVENEVEIARGPIIVEKPTGTSFLPEETLERAKKGNPTEKAKLKKDPINAWVDVYEYARKIREGEMTWKEVEKADLDTRVKYVGMLHRNKRTPGQFLMRLKVPNGIVNSDQMRFYADSVEKYGEKNWCCRYYDASQHSAEGHQTRRRSRCH